MKQLIYLMIFTLLGNTSFAQDEFNYSIELEPIAIENIVGLHSYAFGKHNGKWLIIGGRLDGIHARQPFNAFPQSQNNTDVYVIDIEQRQVWSASLSSLQTSIKEQLQSTNMNFYQDGDTLYIIGGYAYSATAQDHITFPYLSTVQVSQVINAVVSGNGISSFFKQIKDDVFAVTGGQLGKLGNTFYLVGGQRFDGRYNPMNNPTFTQEYTNQIRKFTVNNSGSGVSYSNYSTVTDPIHLHRRDYNLLPQVFPDGSHGYTISSGVFRPDADLPFLYPVDIKDTGYFAVTQFNQYLSNYHNATATLYDSINNRMHNLFFGGISQYYYHNGAMVQDNQVPFVKTISRVTRFADGSLQEYQMPVEMPGLRGAGAEFIPNHDLPAYVSEVIKLSEISSDTILLGHIYGGINSSTLNPFSNNQSSTTSADTTVYAVKLIKKKATGVIEINGNNKHNLRVYPNPATTEITLEYTADGPKGNNYYITNIAGEVLKKGELPYKGNGSNRFVLQLTDIEPQTLSVTVVIANRYFLTQKLVLHK